MNRITLKAPWPSSPVVSFRHLCLVCLSWGHWLCAGRVWGFQSQSYLRSVCRPQIPKKGNSRSCQCRNPNPLFTSLSFLDNPEWEPIPLGSEGAARTINNIFPPRWCVAVLFLTRGWISVLVHAQSCDLLWFERLCKSVRNSPCTPAWPVIHSAGSDSSVLRTNTGLPAFHKSFQN